MARDKDDILLKLSEVGEMALLMVRPRVRCLAERGSQGSMVDEEDALSSLNH